MNINPEKERAADALERLVELAWDGYFDRFERDDEDESIREQLEADYDRLAGIFAEESESWITK